MSAFCFVCFSTILTKSESHWELQMPVLITFQLDATVSLHQVTQFRRKMHTTNYRMCWFDKNKICVELPSSCLIYLGEDEGTAHDAFELALREEGLLSNLEQAIFSKASNQTMIVRGLRLCHDNNCSETLASQSASKKSKERAKA
jgi:hypothetical protein